MNNIKVWPHMTVVAILCAIVAGLGVAFYLKHEQTAQAQALPYAARIQRVDGEVAFNNAPPTIDQANYNPDANWVAATPNQPFSVGDRIYTRDNARTSLAFTGRNFARLNPNTSLDVIDLSDQRTQLALRDGSAVFDVGNLSPGELFEVGTPYGAVDFDQPGLYNVGLSNGNAVVSVLSGLAQVVGLGGSGQVNKGEMLTLLGQTAAQVVLSRMNGNDAGYLVDDYYRYQYPNNYDGRYNNYDAYLNDPYYYDPYRRDQSYQYAPAIIPGLNDLSSYGDWQNVDGYGYAWRPREDASWAPYQQGSWVNDYPYGPTWVSSETWGYAPYHYGRWANVGNQWYWVPDSVNTTPSYSPALVAFLPLNDSNQIGWVPLAPGDPYAPRYYDTNWQPYYPNGNNAVASQLINLAIPNAVTVVPVDAWGRQIDRRSLTTVNPQLLTQVRPVLDPLMLTPLRNAAVNSAWGRGKIDLPPGIAKKLYETSVVTSVTPNAPRFGKDFARALRVQQVPDKAKGEKLKWRDDRQGNQAQGQGQGGQGGQADAARAQRDVERQQRIATLAAQAAQGNRGARQQVRQLEQEQRKQQQEVRKQQDNTQRAQREEAQRTQQAQRAAEQTQRAQQRQQAQGERVSRPARQEAPRQQKAQQQPRLGPPQRQEAPARVQQQAAPRPQPVQKQRPEPPAQQQQASPKHERQGPPTQAPGQGGGGGGGGGGKGKGKKP